jgi:hypothetical protein
MEQIINDKGTWEVIPPNKNGVSFQHLIEPSPEYQAELDLERITRENDEREAEMARQQLRSQALAIKEKLDQGTATVSEMQWYMANTREIV